MSAFQTEIVVFLTGKKLLQGLSKAKSPVWAVASRYETLAPVCLTERDRRTEGRAGLDWRHRSVGAPNSAMALTINETDADLEAQVSSLSITSQSRGSCSIAQCTSL